MRIKINLKIKAKMATLFILNNPNVNFLSLWINEQKYDAPQH